MVISSTINSDEADAEPEEPGERRAPAEDDRADLVGDRAEGVPRTDERGPCGRLVGGMRAPVVTKPSPFVARARDSGS